MREQEDEEREAHRRKLDRLVVDPHRTVVVVDRHRDLGARCVADESADERARLRRKKHRVQWQRRLHQGACMVTLD